MTDYGDGYDLCRGSCPETCGRWRLHSSVLRLLSSNSFHWCILRRVVHVSAWDPTPSSCQRECGENCAIGTWTRITAVVRFPPVLREGILLSTFRYIAYLRAHGSIKAQPITASGFRAEAKLDVLIFVVIGN